MEPIENRLAKIGPGFCAAKWKQVTIHLGTGLTHSCHHPVPHKIPLEEIEKNPSALHNTSFKKQQRMAMLNGNKPAECAYCWKIEDTGKLSDRHHKSSEYWAEPFIDSISKMDGTEDVAPSYLEVSFSNLCNLKCTYCAPEASSKWADELNIHGPLWALKGTRHEHPIQGYQDLEHLVYRHRDNKYIEAFWKWFPEIYDGLKVFRITGGEPLMCKDTFRCLDMFIAQPNHNLEFAINTNLNSPEELWEKFIARLRPITNSLKKVSVYASVEGWGEKAEYARSGLDFNKFIRRCEEILDIGNVQLIIMSTFNIFSISSFRKLLEWQYEMKRKYNPSYFLAAKEERLNIGLNNPTYQSRKERNPAHIWVLGIDITQLHNPNHLDVNILPYDLKAQIIEDCKYMAQHLDTGHDHQGFEEFELEKFSRIVNNIMYHQQSEQDLVIARARFYDAVVELDRRRGTNFLETFPEYEDFFEHCKECREKAAIDDFALDPEYM